LGAAVEKRWLEDVLSQRWQIAGLVPEFTPHDLRHANGMWARAAGVSPWLVQQQLGHSSVVTTEIYAKGNFDGSKVVQLTVLSIRDKALQASAV